MENTDNQTFKYNMPRTDKYIAQVIKEEVSRHFDRTIEDIIGASHKHLLTIPRHAIVYFLKMHTGLSLRNISAEVGRKDHSTAIHAIKNINDFMDTQHNFKIGMLDLNEKIKKRL